MKRCLNDVIVYGRGDQYDWVRTECFLRDELVLEGNDAVVVQRRPKDVKEEAYVAIGGPLLGGAAAIGCSFAGITLDSPLLISLADFGLMIVRVFLVFRSCLPGRVH